jgi:hypothetical protein
LEGFSTLFSPQMARRLSVVPVGKYHYDPMDIKKYVHLALVEFKKEGPPENKAEMSTIKK